MSQRLEYTGRFLAEIDDYGLFQSPRSQAVAVDIFFTTLTYLDSAEPAPYEGYRTRGRYFLLGKSGDVFEEKAIALADATGWDGDLNSIASGTWQPKSPVQIIVGKEVDNEKGRTYYNAFRIFPENWQPPRAGNVSAEDGRQIASRYSNVFKSVVAQHCGSQADHPTDPPAPPRPSAPQDAPTSEVLWTPETVWAQFLKKACEMDEEAIRSVWDEAIRHHGNSKPLSELTQEEWSQVAAIDPQSWTPF